MRNLVNPQSHRVAYEEAVAQIHRMAAAQNDHTVTPKAEQVKYQVESGQEAQEARQWFQHR